MLDLIISKKFRAIGLFYPPLVEGQSCYDQYQQCFVRKDADPAGLELLLSWIVLPTEALCFKVVPNMTAIQKGRVWLEVPNIGRARWIRHQLSACLHFDGRSGDGFMVHRSNLVKFWHS